MALFRSRELILYSSLFRNRTLESGEESFVGEEVKIFCSGINEVDN